jgi:hypothetical protein
MNETAVQQKIVAIARRYGLNPGSLTTDQYTRFSLMAREGLRAKVDAAASALSSVARTRLLGMRVVPEVAASNKAKCEACPDAAFSVLADGAPACGQCGCSGRLLISKWVDPHGECPQGHWKNVGMPTVNSKPISGEQSGFDGTGDAAGKGQVG